MILDQKFEISRRVWKTNMVKMTQDDENFYLDNCHGEYVAICTNTVPGDWKKKKKREETRIQWRKKTQ